MDSAQLLQTLLNQLAISIQLNMQQPAPLASQPIGQAPPPTIGHSRTQGSVEERTSIAPNPQPRILEERPPKTPAKI
jgi:hypothetical protein